MTRAESHRASAVFDAPVLADLDRAGRDAISAACRIHEFAPGEAIFREGDPGDSFFVVLTGAVSLRGVRRGDDQAAVVRVARRGDTFGEEVTLPGLARRTTAGADERAGARVAEIPIAVFRRVTGRPGAGQVADRERRYLERAATRDVLAQLALGRDLAGADLDLLLDAARLAWFARGEQIYDVGDAADAALFIVEGLVQIVQMVPGDGEGSRPQPRAYLTRGDLFGDAEALAGESRRFAAIAAGDTACLRVPAQVLRAVSDRNPGAVARMRRVAEQRDVRQADILSRAQASSTQHVFRDLYRMQMARSLLVIDQDSCVRCGHCAWSCAEVHGVSRLIRRGDQIMTTATSTASAGARLASSGVTTGGAVVARPRNLLVPNSCQHCRNPACMIDCPTGAIGRDPEGEVFIRAELCTGCGNCARACPWDNIQLAPRASGRSSLASLAARASLAANPRPDPGADGADAPRLSREIAVKCDLCREFEAPACVQACPTESLLRIDPSQDLAEVAHILGVVSEIRTDGDDVTGGAPSRPGSIRALAVGAALALALPLAALGWSMHAASRWAPGRGVGLAAGVLAAALMLLLAGHAVPKRVVRLWMRRRECTSAARRATDDSTRPRRSHPRSRLAPLFALHLALGALAPAAVIAHAGAGPRGEANAPAQLIWWSFWLVVLLGALGAAVYRVIPRRLARLESRGALPEDLAGEREALDSRLYRATSGRSEVVKALAQRVLLPYARRTLGWVALIASGRNLRAERRRLRARIDAMLAGRGEGKLAGLDDLIQTVVEARALPARRWLTAALRGWLPAHAIATGIALAALLVHVVAVALGGP